MITLSLFNTIEANIKGTKGNNQQSIVSFCGDRVIHFDDNRSPVMLQFVRSMKVAAVAAGVAVVIATTSQAAADLVPQPGTLLIATSST